MGKAEKQQERMDTAVAKLAAKGWLEEVKKIAPPSTRADILESEARNARRGR